MLHEIVVGTFNDSTEFEWGMVAEENPDDVAEDNSGTGVMTPMLCIFHVKFENTGKALASVFIPVALSCQSENRIVNVLLLM